MLYLLVMSVVDQWPSLWRIAGFITCGWSVECVKQTPTLSTPRSSRHWHNLWNSLALTSTFISFWCMRVCISLRMADSWHILTMRTSGSLLSSKLVAFCELVNFFYFFGNGLSLAIAFTIFIQRSSLCQTKSNVQFEPVGGHMLLCCESSRWVISWIVFRGGTSPSGFMRCLMHWIGLATKRWDNLSSLM